MSMQVRRAWWRDLSMPAIVAGFITVLVGFASSAVIVFQAAQAVGADQAQIASWMWALGLGMGVTCIGLSLRYRVPVVTAWSTPGAAMLVVGAGGASLSEATGAFLLAAVLGLLAGFSGVFARLMQRVPMALAAGMLAGVLLRFGLDVFVAMNTQLVLALAMFATWLAGRRLFPRYAVIATLLVGIAVAASRGLLHAQQVHLQLAIPQWVTPSLSWTAVAGIALPLFVVTMASQNIPGVAVMRASGYDAPVSPLIGWIGVVNTLLAPFGAYALNLAAITAAICMGRDAHEDPARRYTAAMAAGAFYIVIGLFGATVAALFRPSPGSWWPAWPVSRCSAPSATAWPVHWRWSATARRRWSPSLLPPPEFPWPGSARRSGDCWPVRCACWCCGHGQRPEQPYQAGMIRPPCGRRY